MENAKPTLDTSHLSRYLQADCVKPHRVVTEINNEPLPDSIKLRYVIQHNISLIHQVNHFVESVDQFKKVELQLTKQARRDEETIDRLRAKIADLETDIEQLGQQLNARFDTKYMKRMKNQQALEGQIRELQSLNRELMEQLKQARTQSIT